LIDRAQALQFLREALSDTRSLDGTALAVAPPAEPVLQICSIVSRLPEAQVGGTVAPVSERSPVGLRLDRWITSAGGDKFLTSRTRAAGA
jgi:hypothetical protein